MKLCMGCMEHYDDELKVCPHCGYEEDRKPDSALYLTPGTILNDRYIIGRVLGCGGFGVTYIAWDGFLQMKVAVKEFLPNELSSRATGQERLSVYDGDKQKRFEEGLKKFGEEAKKLAKFNSIPGVVQVFDTFEANNTAYLIMEFLDGETVASMLEREGALPVDKTIEMILPVLEALTEVHKAGVIHRDISPDNLFVTKSGDVKLIDFGSARFAATDNNMTMTVIIKNGFSPAEQYNGHAKQGAYTDVYSIAATMYKMMTGTVPPDAFERHVLLQKKGKDNITPISKLNKEITPDQETAIMNALNVRVEDRTPDVKTFIEELTGVDVAERRTGKIRKKSSGGWPLWAKITLPAASVAVVTLIALLAAGVLGGDPDIDGASGISDGDTYVPYVISCDVDEGSEKLVNADLNMTILGKQESDQVPEEHILSQDVNGGAVVAKNTNVNVIVSAPDPKQIVPDIRGTDIKFSEGKLSELGFNVKVKEEDNDVIEKGCVISQDHDPFAEADEGDEITITVSNGSANRAEKEITVPDFVGMTYDEVLAKAQEIGCSVMVTEHMYSSSYDRDVIMSQQPGANAKIKNTTPVAVVVSLGYEEVTVPNVELRTEEKAKSQLIGRGLEPEITYESDETVGEGLVKYQAPKKNSSVFPESVIELIVSTGAAPFPMPDVVGMAQGDAQLALADKKLSVQMDYQHNTDVPEGEILAQSVKAGDDVRRGETIVLTAATKENVTPVPNVVGMKRSEAEKTLEDSKLTAYINAIEDSDDAIVISQSPSAGINLKEQSIVTVNVGISIPAIFEEESDTIQEQTDTTEEESEKEDVSSAAPSSKPAATESDKKSSSSSSKPSSSSKSSSSSRVTSSAAASSRSDEATTHTTTENNTSSKTSGSVSSHQQTSPQSSRPQTKTSSVQSKPVQSEPESSAPVEVSSISLSSSELTLNVGDSASLSADIKPVNAADKSVSWSSSDDSVASVSDGVVTANGEGSATVTAVSSNGKTAECNVVVYPVKKGNGSLKDSGECGSNVTWEYYDDGTIYINGSGAMTNYDYMPQETHLQRNSLDYASVTWQSDRPWYNYLGEIERVVIGDGVTTVGSCAFAEAGNLRSVELADSVTAIEFQAFQNCNALSNVSFSNNISSIGTLAFYSACGSSGITMNLPSSVSTVGKGAFDMQDGEVYFTGNKPSFGIDPLWGDDEPDQLTWEPYGTVTIYYPASNSTWDGIQENKTVANGVDIIPY